MTTSYLDSVKLLTSQGKFYINLGLERVSAVLELLGNPQDKIKIVHVAGTNGKGSVSSILANILNVSGYKTGLYTSPHLFEYTERIKINGSDISEDLFAKYIFDISKVADAAEIHLTEFEILTVVVYKYFYDENIDIAVIETGLGGRFDATNAISSDLFSIITSISMDHIDRLGDTIEKIAFEKAGIIKKDSSVVVAQDNLGFETVTKQAKCQNANVVSPNSSIELVWDGKTNYAIINGEKFEFSLFGLWQKDNLKLVVAALELLKSKGYTISLDNLKMALKTCKWPARMQYIKEKNILIDGAHNADGANRLIESLDYYFPDKKRIWIYGSLNTKEYEKVVKTLFRENDDVYFYEFSNKNAISAKEIKSFVNNTVTSVKLAQAENMLNYFDENCLTIVSGSLYMIGEIFDKIKL